MSFADAFAERWQRVLQPAIASVTHEGRPLEPHRVDLRTTGDSILTEILDEIGSSRLVLADISAVEDGAHPLTRNANVLYEVGIAHAMRQPEEVILLRSDSSSLPFDVANVRVHRYHPDVDPDAARRVVISLLESALAAVELKRSLAVRSALSLLDYAAFALLLDASKPQGVRHPLHPEERAQLGLIRTWPRVSALDKLLSVGAVRAHFGRVTVEALAADGPPESLVTIHATELGRALALHAYDAMGFEAEEIKTFMEEHRRSQSAAKQEAPASPTKRSVLERILGLGARAV